MRRFMKSKGKTAPARSVNDYLAMLPENSRAALKGLRKTIKVAAPKAVEKISHRMPMYNYLGMLVAFAAFKDHCSFFVMSPSVMEAHKHLLKSYDTAEGTIRFTIDKPLPTTLVKRLVKARVRENQEALRRRKTASQVGGGVKRSRRRTHVEGPCRNH